MNTDILNLFMERQVEQVRRCSARQLVHPGSKSWHDECHESPYIIVKNLPPGFPPSDILAVFEQYGHIPHLHQPLDPSRSTPANYAFIGYEDWRSTILAVDNLNGISLSGQTILVTHVQDYHPPSLS